MLMPETFRDGRQRVLDPQPDWLEGLKKEYPRHGDTFFVGQDMVTGNYMLLGWCNKPKKMFVSLMVLGGRPETLDWDQRHELKMLIDPPQAADSDEGFFDERTGKTVMVLTPEKMRKMQEAKRLEEAREDVDDHEELLDLKRYLHKKALAKGKGDSTYWADVKDRVLIPQRLAQ